MKQNYACYKSISNQTLQPFDQKKQNKKDVFVKHGCPRRQQSPNIAEISMSYILTPPQSRGQVMSVGCEHPLHELTFKFATGVACQQGALTLWLLYHHANFKYYFLYVSGTDGQTIQTLDDPGGPFRQGGIKTYRP